MQDSAYLGELGGLSRHRQLIMFDLRGTGGSGTPVDVSSYRCDRLVDDVESLRDHLGLDSIDLLAHCAGANLAVRYVERHPASVRTLTLITPSVIGVGITVPPKVRRATALLRKDEPWFPDAFRALETIMSGAPGAGAAEAVAPFFHGRWDHPAQVLHAAADDQRNAEAAAVFASEGAFDPAATRAALGRFEGRVLVVAGEVDLNSPPAAVAEFAGLFPHPEYVVQPGAGHFPWLDDAERFVATTA
jgi:proline iminopeptidase